MAGMDTGRDQTAPSSSGVTLSDAAFLWGGKTAARLVSMYCMGRTRYGFRGQIPRQSEHYLTAAGQRRWHGSFAVQEAAMYRRLLLTAFLGFTLSACVPYYDGGSSYYSSEVYSTPAPAYYSGGGYYSSDRGYSAPRYYQPAPRYYQASPRYYQPAPRYYQAPPRAAYRPYPNGGWDGHNRQNWGGGGGHGGRDNHGGRGDHGRGDNGRGGHNR